MWDNSIICLPNIGTRSFNLLGYAIHLNNNAKPSSPDHVSLLSLRQYSCFKCKAVNNSENPCLSKWKLILNSLLVYRHVSNLGYYLYCPNVFSCSHCSSKRIAHSSSSVIAFGSRVMISRSLSRSMIICMRKKIINEMQIRIGLWWQTGFYPVNRNKCYITFQAVLNCQWKILGHQRNTCASIWFLLRCSNKFFHFLSQ